MAVSKLWSVTSRLGQVIDYAANPEKTATDIYTEEQYQALRDVLSYAKDEEKTECEFFVEGINCNPATARDQFVSVKKAYGKDDGIQAYHGYLSFKEQDISPELAQKIGMEFANEVWGKRFQVVVTTHLNTKHLHCHYVINSVSFVDGKRLWGDEKAWFKFRLVADRLCEKYGLYYNPNPNRSKQSSYYYKQEQAGMPSRYSITRDAIDEAIAHSTNLKTFDYILTQMGYAPFWEKKVLTVEEAAEYTGIGRTKIRQIIMRGDCPFAVTNGVQVCVIRDKFIDYLDKQFSI